MTGKKVWVNGKLLDRDNAVISVFDRGFLYGDGVFETMRAYAGVVFMVDEHLKRLFKSLRILKIESRYSAAELRQAIYRALSANALKSAYIRITVTRGAGAPGINYKPGIVPNVAIMVMEFEGYPLSAYRKGITAKLAGIRQNDFSPVSGLKSLSFLNYIMARQEAVKAGFDEAILTDCKGYIAEAAAGNIFLVNNEVLITPPKESPILPGITRGVILEIAKSLKVGISQKKITYRQLVNSDEVFLTNSLAEVIPVIRVDSKKIGRGLPGEVTKLLHVSYQKEVIRSVIA